MNIDIGHADITSELCQRCAACCRISLKIVNAGTRYRRFLRTLGFNVRPAAHEGRQNCCDQQHDVHLDMGYCKHLRISFENGEEKNGCTLYGMADFPELCADFDCVSWAKHDNTYNDTNATILAAQTALNRLRAGVSEDSASALLDLRQDDRASGEQRDV